MNPSEWSSYLVKRLAFSCLYLLNETFFILFILQTYILWLLAIKFTAFLIWEKNKKSKKENGPYLWPIIFAASYLSGHYFLSGFPQPFTNITNISTDQSNFYIAIALTVYFVLEVFLKGVIIKYAEKCCHLFIYYAILFIFSTLQDQSFLHLWQKYFLSLAQVHYILVSKVTSMTSTRPKFIKFQHYLA